MQGHRSTLSTLPENSSFDHGSLSSDIAIDSQVPWNTMQSSAHNHLPDYMLSSSKTNQRLHHFRHEGWNAEWCSGETSSSSALTEPNCSEARPEHTPSIHSHPALTPEDRQYETSNSLSLGNDINPNGSQNTSGPLLIQNSIPDAFAPDLNMISGFGDDDDDDDDCQIIEHPNAYTSVGLSTKQMPSSGSSSSPFAMPSVMESEDRPGCSSDGRRMSCKRKARELQVGQSSGAGSSTSFQNAERSQSYTETAAGNISIPSQMENELVITDGADRGNPRVRLSDGGTISASPFSLTASGSSESSRRNPNLPIHQQDRITGNLFLAEAEADIANRDVASSRHSSRSVFRDSFFELNPPQSVENGGSPGQYAPSVRRNPQTRWSRASSSRLSRSSALNISGERDNVLYEDSTAMNIPRSISEHPMFVPSSETGSSSQHPTNWNWAGESYSMVGDVPSTSRVGPSAGDNSSANRTRPQFPRRLSEMVRRSLESSPQAAQYGGQSSNNALRSGSSLTSQEMELLAGTDAPSHQNSNSRSALLERHLDRASRVPYSLRTLAAAGEGRSSIMSEIRHVLNLMRRGEGLRFEDFMLLDHSVLFGMSNIRDRHRDMRLDVDNMSYEELLALGERIGDVCTGLNEETILSRLKQQKYTDSKAPDQVETEPCSICQEEYKAGEDLGILDCEHEFHRDCVKQWLLHKNLCPICKKTALSG